MHSIIDITKKADDLTTRLFPGKSVFATNEDGRVLVDVSRFDSEDEAEEALETLREALEKSGFSIYDDSSNDGNFADQNIWLLVELKALAVAGK